MSSETLSRERIVGAAIELLDAEGVEGLSMRRLGGALGSGATSVYWHVKNKDDLISLAADEVHGEIELPDPGEVGWRAAAAAMAYGLREMFRRHAWIVPVFGTHIVFGPGIARFNDRFIAVFEAAGFAGSDLDRAGETVLAFVLGIAYADASEAAMNARLRRKGVNVEEYIKDVVASGREVAADFPRLLERYDAQSNDIRTAVSEQSFEFGLETVLDGLAARLAENS